jgi:hypothetical protein
MLLSNKQKFPKFKLQIERKYLSLLLQIRNSLLAQGSKQVNFNHNVRSIKTFPKDFSPYRFYCFNVNIFSKENKNDY